MAAKKPKEPTGDRLKIEGDWKDAARKLLKTPPGSTPPRKVKPRKKPKL